MLFGIYMAAMTAFVLDHKDQVDDQRTVKLGTYEMLLDYCQNPDNRISIDRELGKAMEAKRAGKLEQYLGL